MTPPDTHRSSIVDVDGLAERDTPMPPTLVLCRCGHPRSVHEHYRPGSDCGLCAPVCQGWRPPRWRWLRRYGFLSAELARLAEEERKLRNVIALRRYNPGPAA